MRSLSDRVGQANRLGARTVATLAMTLAALVGATRLGAQAAQLRVIQPVSATVNAAPVPRA